MFYLGIGVGREPSARGIAEALLPHAEGRIETHTGHGCLAVSVTPTAWGAARREMQVCEEDGLVACAWARIDNARDLARALGDESFALAAEAPRLIIAAYRKWGEEAPRHLEGDFAFAIHDPATGTIFAARDALGIRPLYWIEGQSGAPGACATSIPALRQATGRLHGIDPDWVARFIAGASMSCEATPFPGISKVPRGHSLRLTADGARLSRYHDLADEIGEPTESEAALLERYRDLLEKAVSARMAGHGGLGIEISGGLDSSTVLALALRHQESAGRRIHGFGWTRHDLEGPAVIGVSQRLGLAHNHLLAAETDPIPRDRVWSILGHPAEHGSATHHWPIYTLAQQLGVTGLLSGFGGDEGVTNYAPNFPREMLDRQAYLTLWKALAANPVLRTAKFVRAVLRRGSGSFYSRRLSEAARQRVALLPLTRDAIARLAIDDRIQSDAQYDAPFATVKAFSAHMLSRPFVSTRTESCSLIAANNGVEYAWPLLDRRLLACFLKAPPTSFFRDGMGRALHRRAVAGIVPDERRLAPSKYLGTIVEPLHRPAVEAHSERAGSLPDWTGLEPMVQDLVDREKMDNLVRNVSAPGAGTRQSLRALGEVNQWLASKP